MPDERSMVRIVPYHSEWPELFHDESLKLTAALNGEVIAIHHMGSTAIPGMDRAKPIIDVLVEVREIGRVDDHDNKMIELGYEPRGEYGIPGRRYFVRHVEGMEAIRSYHVHAYQSRHSEIERHLNFRDFLIAHCEEAQAYSRLKERLAEEFPGDTVRYTDGKTDFIMETDRKARTWKEKESS